MRAKLEGSITVRVGKDGRESYRIAIDMGKDNGGKYVRQFETAHSMKQAKDRLKELARQRDEGKWIRPGKQTLANYLTAWLKDTAFPNMTPRTYQGYEFNIQKHIIPALGQIQVKDLQPQHIQSLCAKLQAAGKHRTAQYIFATLSKALNAAVKMGALAHNPCEGVDKPRVTRHEMKTLNENELGKFLEQARGTEYFPVFFTALHSGMRRSEYLALRWSDVDLLMLQVSINRTVQVISSGAYKGQIIYKAPKTVKSRRLVDLTPSNSLVLKEHLEARKHLLKSLNPKFDPDKDFNQNELVFCHWDGSAYQPDTISHAWQALARASGLEGIRLHDARHTHASLMLKQGVHPKIVQERLGHATITTTLDIYSHVVPGLQAAAASKFDTMLAPKPEAVPVQT